MSGSFANKPRILHGAFVEYGLSLPPLAVVFQFNPEQLARNRSLTFSAPGGEQAGGRAGSLRDFHLEFDDLTKLRDAQLVTVNEETISFDIRLDATDRLDEGDSIAERYGIAPQLATLELMVYPKDESLLGKLLGSPGGFSFTKKPNPPLILFVWGRKRVLPVNITSLDISETLYNTDLNPTRATAKVSLTVIEGKVKPYLYTKLMKEAASALHLAHMTDVANVIIPG
jgi:hypothetical protein